MLNKAILMGRLTKDPELRTTNSGIPVTSFSLAVDRQYSKDKEKETDFLDIVCWQARAEFVCKHFTKGQQMAVEGRIQQRKWQDKTGATRYAVEVIAESVHFAGYKKDESNGGQGEEYYNGESYAYSDFDPFVEDVAA